MLFCACGTSSDKVEHLFQDSTVVYIPLKPDVTEVAPTVTVPSEPEPTLLPAETTSAPTNADADISSSPTTAAKPSSGKSSSGTTVSQKPASAATTEPASTEPAETQMPVTEPRTSSVYDITGYAVSALEQAVAAQINACRTEAEVESLALNATLCAIAAVRAYEVCLSWSHTRPSGAQWQSVLSDYGFGYCNAAEALAYTAGFDAVSIVSKWMNADSTLADILNADFTTVGVGIHSVDGTMYIAAIFTG